MPEEVNTMPEGSEDTEQPETDSTDTEQLDGDMFADDAEDAEGALEADGEDAEGGEEDDEFEEVDLSSVLADTPFKSVEDLKKGYKELQGKFTQSSQKSSEQEKKLNELMQKVQDGKQGELTDEEYNRVVEELNRNPQAWVRKEAAEQIRQERQREQTYNKVRDKAHEEAAAQLASMDDYADLDDDTLELMDKIVESDDYNIKAMFDAVTLDNYDQYDPTSIKDYYTKLYRMAADIAKGRKSGDKIAETKANANKTAKKRYLQRKRLDTTKPNNKAKPTGGKGGSSADEAEIQAILNATGF